MGNFGIRSAREEDVGTPANLMDELGYPTNEGSMKRRLGAIAIDPSYGTLVAERDGEMAAVHIERTLEADAGGARIMSLVVASKHRGRGVGRALISAAEEWAGERDADTIMLTTHRRRAGAHEFYRLVGYEITGYRLPQASAGRRSVSAFIARLSLPSPPSRSRAGGCGR